MPLQRICLQLLQLHFCWRYELEWTIELIAKEIDMVGILIMAVRGDVGLDGKVHQRDLQRYLDSVFTEQAEAREFNNWRRFWAVGTRDWKELY